jgi:hypothetical protein
MTLTTLRFTVGSQAFLVSTSKELLPHAFVQDVFAHDDGFWAWRGWWRIT